jgi:tetratricopeptide (TPR) repeat protein
MYADESTPLFTRLWDRKVPQLLGTYLAVGFGLLQFLEFVVNRYELAGSLVDKYLVIWLVALPAIGILIYHRGLPPAKKASQQVLVAGNLGLALALGIFLFNGSSGGPESVEVNIASTAKDLQGNVRQVPEASAIKKLAIFPFENKTGKEEQDFWELGLPNLLMRDLEQRPEYYVYDGLSMQGVYGLFELDYFARINQGNQRRIAQRIRSEYFISGAYEEKEGLFSVSGSIFRTRDGKKLYDLSAEAASPYATVDILKESIIEQLPDPLAVDEFTTDLPASSLLTDVPEALDAYLDGSKKFIEDPGNLPPSRAAFVRALTIDPSCADCHFQAGDKTYGMGQRDSALVYVRKAIKLADVLPDRDQFYYKTVLYNLEGKYDAIVDLMEVQRKLYPYEYRPYATLSSFYEREYGVDSAIVLMQEAAAISDREASLNKLYSLYLDKDDFEAAKATLDELSNDFPTSEGNKAKYIYLYQQWNKPDEARTLLKELMTVDPFNYRLHFQLVSLEEGAGNYDGAEEIIRSILAETGVTRDSVNAMDWLINLAVTRGHLKEGQRLTEDRIEIASSVSPVNVQLQELYSSRASMLIMQDNLSDLEELIAELKSYDEERGRMYECFTAIFRSVHNSTSPPTMEELIQCRPTFAALGGTMQLMAELYEMVANDEFPTAAQLVAEQMDEGLDIAGGELAQARILRWGGRLDRAEELVRQNLALRVRDPYLHFELAQILAEKDPAAARESLDVALEVWDTADEEFLPKKRALELLEELSSAS